MRLLGSTLTTHTNFLAEGKCAIRLTKPVGYSVMMSKIPAHHLQAAVHLLNAVAASCKGRSVHFLNKGYMTTRSAPQQPISPLGLFLLSRPDGLTSSTVTGEGDYHANDRSDMTTKKSKPAAARKPLGSLTNTLNAAGKRSSCGIDDGEDHDDDDDDDRENIISPASKRRAEQATANTAMVHEMNARKNGTILGSPRRYLSPQSVRFLQLTKPERTRVLAAHPTFQAKRVKRAASESGWTEREVAYEKALLDPNISIEQREVLKKVVQGESVFFTGSAGTGKSFLIHKILSCLPGMGTQTYATSTTGITAMAIQGMTVYAWTGLGVLTGRETSQELAQRILRNRDTLTRWRSTKSLLIDEISMLDGQLFQQLHEVAQLVRGNTLPFGGIQLLLCGDFFQLPPVSPNGGAMKPFAFEAECWEECVGGNTVELSQVYRQKSGAFVEILDELRRGRCSDESAHTLKQCEDTDLYSLTARDGIRPTSLLTLKREVDDLNTRELSSLSGAVQNFRARDTGAGSAMEVLAASCPARASLDLKVGAQVILLRNLDVSSGLCNGSRGIVVKFSSSSTRHPVVRFLNGAEHTITPETWTTTVGGKIQAQREQIPLDLAWAISIHKSQGMSLDRASVHLTKCFEYGQAYVALSRVRSLEGLQLLGFDRTKIKAHPKVEAFYERLGERRAAERELREKPLSGVKKRLRMEEHAPVAASKSGEVKKPKFDLSAQPPASASSSASTSSITSAPPATAAAPSFWDRQTASGQPLNLMSRTALFG